MSHIKQLSLPFDSMDLFYQQLIFLKPEISMAVKFHNLAYTAFVKGL